MHSHRRLCLRVSDGQRERGHRYHCLHCVFHWCALFVALVHALNAASHARYMSWVFSGPARNAITSITSTATYVALMQKLIFN